GKATMASIETGNAVEWTEEKTYHFRMTALRDRLLAFYEENPGWVVPATRMSEVVYWVKNHLEDLSISRPVSRLEWGIRVPDDPSQTIYVWVDALINYLTKAGFPGWAPGQEHEGGWPADLHIIGKDILRFHCVYWPALLMALDLPLPRRILSHAHWTLGRKKMSKSIGNVVNPYFAIDRWGVDTMRYYMIHDGGIAHDADYGNQMIVDRYKNGLQWGIGNLLGRVTRSKVWNVSEAVQNARGSSLPSFAEEEGKIWKAQREMLGTLPGRVSARMDALDPGAALREIMSAVYLVRPLPDASSRSKDCC
ncbi:MAG: class I tRNA ligase family protein, partial [Thaumarchaeota archaeon]|nr:class I tRNA ligase family protein [Nitrososphaerota archaeon]